MIDWSLIRQNVCSIHSVNKVHIVSCTKSGHTVQPWIILHFLKTAPTTKANARMESSKTAFSLRLCIEIFRRDVYGASIKTMKLFKRAREIRMPSRESAFTFIAFEKDHVMQRLQSIADMFQHPSAKLSAVFNSSDRDISFPTDG